MSRSSAFDLTREDVELLIAAQSHIGSKNVQVRQEGYVYKARPDGVKIINVGKTWEKIVLAARIIAAIPNAEDVCAISARTFGQRAVLKFAAHTGATAIAGRFTPGSFTNYITRSFKEPRLIIVTDPRTDAQAIKEASYVNIPVIALTDTDSPTQFVDVAIPCNNKGRHSIGLIWWMLAREVLRIRGTIPDRSSQWSVMSDLYFYRDPEENEKDVTVVEETIEPAADALADIVDGGNDWGVGGDVNAPNAGDYEASGLDAGWDQPSDAIDWASSAADTSVAVQGSEW